MRELSRGAVFLHVPHDALEGLTRGVGMSTERTNHGDGISPNTLEAPLYPLAITRLFRPEKQTVRGRKFRMYRATLKGVAVREAGRRSVPGVAVRALSWQIGAEEGERHHDH